MPLRGAPLHVQEAMHLGEEERRIYISLTNQERLAAQEDAHAAKVRPFICRYPHSMASLVAISDRSTGKGGLCRGYLANQE